jgi:uncharacterized protein with HEPN domain
MKDNRLYLIHIGECIASIEKFVAGGRDEFMASELIQAGVLRKLQVMAESSQRLPDHRKAAHPDVDWRKIAGFRNILVHDYFGVDLERCWEIIERDLPALKRAVEAILRELGANG